MTFSAAEPKVINPNPHKKATSFSGAVEYTRGDSETYSTNTLNQHVTVTEAQQS